MNSFAIQSLTCRPGPRWKPGPILGKDLRNPKWLQKNWDLNFDPTLGMTFKMRVGMGWLEASVVSRILMISEKIYMGVNNYSFLNKIP